MNEFTQSAITFFVVVSDKVIIPHYDVSKSNIAIITNNFLIEWKNFIRSLQQRYVKHNNLNTELLQLQSDGFNIIHKNNYFISLPTNFFGGYIYNFPDLFDASNLQIQQFISNTNIHLNDLKIRSSKPIITIDYHLNPFNFINLDIDSIWIANLAIKQHETIHKNILISIIVWWLYHNNESTNRYDDIAMQLLSLCTPEIFKCHFFIMLYTRFIELNCNPIIKWCNHNINNIIWDEDYISDTPTKHLDICKHIFIHPLFLKELKRRNITI